MAIRTHSLARGGVRPTRSLYYRVRKDYAWETKSLHLRRFWPLWLARSSLSYHPSLPLSQIHYTTRGLQVPPNETPNLKPPDSNELNPRARRSDREVILQPSNTGLARPHTLPSVVLERALRNQIIHLLLGDRLPARKENPR